MGFEAVALTHRVDPVLQPPERLFVQSHVAFRHRPPEVDDPLPGWTPGQVHPVHPGLQDVSVRPPVRVRRQTEPLARLVARNVEGTALRIAHERDTGVLWKTPDRREVDTGVTAAWRQVGVDLVDELPVQANFTYGLSVSVREADQRHPHGRAVDHPGLVAPRLEDPSAVDRRL